MLEKLNAAGFDDEIIESGLAERAQKVLEE
jgi:hypothetical protein